ncbi:hypothetical protein [Enterococcus gilvus]|uniref:hypothetical protein n=1 Tax=Enterococcus gilvus TaxID=160453 RepID=UPI001C8CB286|nr:hypothetical protein [Enterococcus gilvus]MBX8938408.1 hypothetical protein [Enterococcus gilvus]
MVKNYEAFFKFSLVLMLLAFVISNFADTALLEFAKGFSTALLMVSAFFKIRKDSANKTNSY